MATKKRKPAQAQTTDSGVVTEDAPSGEVALEDEQPSASGPLWSDELRADLLTHHPINVRKYTVPTPMLKHAYEATRERVWARRTGVVFYGETRVGRPRVRKVYGITCSRNSSICMSCWRYAEVPLVQGKDLFIG
jgi:hypothetical protein